MFLCANGLQHVTPEKNRWLFRSPVMVAQYADATCTRWATYVTGVSSALLTAHEITVACLPPACRLPPACLLAVLGGLSHAIEQL
jgi:hypothetical protein